MIAGVLERKIRRKLLKRLLLPLLLLLGCLSELNALNTQGLLKLEGTLYPYDVTGSSDCIRMLERDQSRMFVPLVKVAVRGRDIVDVGMEESIWEERSANYIAVPVENMYLICETSPSEYDEWFTDSEEYTFSGVLRTVDDDMLKVLVDTASAQGYTSLDVRSVFFMSYVSPSPSARLDRATQYAPFFLMLILAVLFTLFPVLSLLDITRVAALRKLPDGMEPTATLERIEGQYLLAAPRRTYRIGLFAKVCLAENWLIKETFWGIRFYLADEILWAYLAFGQYKGEAPERNNSTGHLWIMQKGNSFSLYGRAQQLRRLLDGLLQAYPWMLAGYSPDVAGNWNNDIKKLVDAAERRKTKIGFRDYEA